MGITSTSLQRIDRYIKPNSNILIVGCQNIYSAENYGEIAQDYFRELGHTVKSIDIYACNGAEVADLREDLKFGAIYDLVLQHGTVEHVDGALYWPFKNIHEACKVGGIMIHENPETKSWPNHGQHYFDLDFYLEFCKLCNYELLENTREAAMSNTVDGWNISAVIRKIGNSKFPTEDEFNKLKINKT